MCTDTHVRSPIDSRVQGLTLIITSEREVIAFAMLDRHTSTAASGTLALAGDLPGDYCSEGDCLRVTSLRVTSLRVTGDIIGCLGLSCLFSATGNAPKKATSQNGSHATELTV